MPWSSTSHAKPSPAWKEQVFRPVVIDAADGGAPIEEADHLPFDTVQPPPCCPAPAPAPRASSARRRQAGAGFVLDADDRAAARSRCASIAAEWRVSGAACLAVEGPGLDPCLAARPALGDSRRWAKLSSRNVPAADEDQRWCFANRW